LNTTTDTGGHSNPFGHLLGRLHASVVGVLGVGRAVLRPRRRPFVFGFLILLAKKKKKIQSIIVEESSDTIRKKTNKKLGYEHRHTLNTHKPENKEGLGKQIRYRGT